MVTHRISDPRSPPRPLLAKTNRTEISHCNGTTTNVEHTNSLKHLNSTLYALPHNTQTNMYTHPTKKCINQTKHALRYTSHRPISPLTPTALPPLSFSIKEKTPPSAYTPRSFISNKSLSPRIPAASTVLLPIVFHKYLPSSPPASVASSFAPFCNPT